MFGVDDGMQAVPLDHFLLERELPVPALEHRFYAGLGEEGLDPLPVDLVLLAADGFVVLDGSLSGCLFTV